MYMSQLIPRVHPCIYVSPNKIKFTEECRSRSASSKWKLADQNLYYLLLSDELCKYLLSKKNKPIKLHTPVATLSGTSDQVVESLTWDCPTCYAWVWVSVPLKGLKVGRSSRWPLVCPGFYKTYWGLPPPNSLAILLE